MWVKKGFSELVTSDLSLKDKKEPALVKIRENSI